jgi:putative thioredoxin
MAIDVTDATFQTEVLDRSRHTPVIVDFWAPWCGPCKTLGPIIEQVVDSTGGQVVLAKINVDENPQIAQEFQVQSIPLVVAFKDGDVAMVNNQPLAFMGAQPERVIQQFVGFLMPSEEEQAIARLIAAGDEASLQLVLAQDPGNEKAVVALAELWANQGRSEEALRLLERIPESPDTRRVAAMARVGAEPQDDYDERLTALLDQVKADDAARQEYVDILELMGPDDPRTAKYRKQLTARLF